MSESTTRPRTTVVQARQKGVTVYVNVSRPSRWGNPYRVGEPDAARSGEPMSLERVLALYEDWLYWTMGLNEDVRTAALALRGKTLGCQCSGAQNGGIDPVMKYERCHAAVLARVIDSWKESENG